MSIAEDHSGTSCFGHRCNGERRHGDRQGFASQRTICSNCGYRCGQTHDEIWRRSRICSLQLFKPRNLWFCLRGSGQHVPYSPAQDQRCQEIYLPCPRCRQEGGRTACCVFVPDRDRKGQICPPLQGRNLFNGTRLSNYVPALQFLYAEFEYHPPGRDSGPK